MNNNINRDRQQNRPDYCIKRKALIKKTYQIEKQQRYTPQVNSVENEPTPHHLPRNS